MSFFKYAEFSEKTDDPDNKIFSPLEGLDYIYSKNFDIVINIPYGFIGENTDTLNALREAFNVQGWDEKYRTKFERNGVEVVITSCNFYPRLREKPYFQTINEQIELIIN